VLVTGPNGAGKTNLLEAVHVGTQGFSPRTRADAQVVRFGEQAGRIALGGARGETHVEVEGVRERERGQQVGMGAEVQGRNEPGGLGLAGERPVW